MNEESNEPRLREILPIYVQTLIVFVAIGTVAIVLVKLIEKLFQGE